MGMTSTDIMPKLPLFARKRYEDLQPGRDYRIYSRRKGSRYGRLTSKEKNWFTMTSSDAPGDSKELYSKNYTYNDSVPPEISRKFDRYERRMAVSKGGVFCRQGIGGFLPTKFYKVIDRDGDTATLQPLSMEKVKQKDRDGKPQIGCVAVNKPDGKIILARIYKSGLIEYMIIGTYVSKWDGRPVI